MVTTNERFWAKVDQYTESGCWLWTASTGASGYGQFSLRGTYVRAHRFAYEMLVGKIPDGLQLDHLCKVRHCVRPSHLEAVTQRENTARSNSQWAIKQRTGFCKWGHEQIGENVYTDPRGFNTCRPCQQAATRRYNIRRRKGRET